MQWLIAGLGNPGPEYELTPHNLGFLVIDRLAERNGIRVSRPDSKALVGTGNIGGQPVLLAKPQTFMNLSGSSVKGLLVKHEIPVGNLIVVCDEMNLPWTGVRVRPNGSAGGQNGMKSVIASLGGGEFSRVRLGVNPGTSVGDMSQFLLSPMRRGQLEELDEVLDHAAGAVESIIADGVEMSMTRFNRRARGLNKEEA